MKSTPYSVKFINFYQRHISRFTKPSCNFYPTCSEFTKQAITKYGSTRGIYLGIKRILRCHPWQKNHIDILK